MRAAFADREKNRKSLVSGGGSGRLKDGLGRLKDGLGGLKVGLGLLYRPSATVLFYFVSKLIFYENKRNLKNS